MTRAPEDPTASALAPVAPQGAALPGGAGPDSPPSGPAGKTSRQAHAPQAPAPDGTPGPETGGRPSDRGQSPVRARAETPAGASGPDSPPAGSTAIAAAMSEDRGPDSLDAHVRKLCADLGLLRYHTHDSRRSPSGFPDLVIVGPRGVLYRELKAQRGRVSAAQQEWLDALAAARQNAAVWRPASLLSGAIAAELAGISAWRTRRGTRCVCDQYGSCPRGCAMCRVCGDAA